ncbi:hypothetical protein HHL28_07465 [Aerophototrophica crusticola]|uniref:Uncharacterized protein n=1 Tax=Aerophototrophica crusticola TaxID=1709002 RepID=A0A858R7D6_9PROT|nr:hypothetical protein HHL28_07465 [Rhodospirillaceae bacterium B3]
MSETYVTLKIREALAAAQGSRAQAQRILVAWALDDDQLLRGLCKPFLRAIAGSAIASAAKGQPAPASVTPAPGQGITRGAKPAPRKLPPQMLDAIIARMGTQQPEPTPPEGGEQAESLKTLAAAFKRKF